MLKLIQTVIATGLLFTVTAAAAEEEVAAEVTTELEAVDAETTDTSLTDLSNRVGCTANLNGFYYNLHALSKPLDDENRILSDIYKVEY